MGAIGTIRGRGAADVRTSGAGGARWHRWLQALGRMLERRRTRMALSDLTDEQLKDIGLSRSQAYREVSRPFWD